MAKEVLAGKWGNGEDRKKRLQAARYDYGAVQRKVNELMRIVGSLLLSVEKSADDGRLIFLFVVSNFYVTNVTVCAIIKVI